MSNPCEMCGFVQPRLEDTSEQQEMALSSTANSVLLGGLLGAGIAYARGRSVIQGAVDGASFGYFADSIISSLANPSDGSSLFAPRGGNATATGLLGEGRGHRDQIDTTEMSYEELLER
jgi:hypothetical protein